MPDGYGVPESDDGLLAWADVEARLVESPQYWLATTRPDGRPHVVPRWGVWLDGGLFYDGAPTTRHVRNLTTNQACTLHLEDGWHAVVVNGRVGRDAKRGAGEVGIHAVRGGTVTGEHEVGFYGSAEQIILTHRAENRGLFAEGAVRAAQFLAGKPAGLYAMQDVVAEMLNG